ncbi:OmpA family protein [Gaoshiqia sediminis]|uniref:OmpA family protein n=1 Tax=Gaoshiqia sediminis TaxID=2986998 RepID=A0AA42CA32_9BACT|nr:OmpA family protein [Gaoshiqia sediminis]MCW0484831.1 OmpA family protein [Gaoshiqia sediminis]
MKENVLKIVLVLLLASLAPSAARAQKITAKVADWHFRKMNFTEAIKLYQYAFQKDTNNAYVARQLAEAYRQTDRPDETARWLRRLINRGDAQPGDVFRYAQALKNMASYEEAAYWEERFAALAPEDVRIRSVASLQDYQKWLQRDTARYQVKPVNLNTLGTEFGPTIFGNQLIYSSSGRTRTTFAQKYLGEPPSYLNLYAGEISDEGKLMKVKPFAPNMQSRHHDGPVSVHPNGEELFLTRNQSRRFRLLGGNGGFLNLEIEAGKKIDGEWESTGGFPYNSKSYSTGHPAIDPSGTVLYFTSDMPGGYGGADLYACRRVDGQWGEPMNLGPYVNTWGNETFPFIGADGVLYFSSDGHPGLGGMDIFRAHPVNGIYTVIENLGYPVNTHKDDLSLALNGEGTVGYFASNRPGGRGEDDLYSLKINKVSAEIDLLARDESTGEVLPDTRILLVHQQTDTTEVGITPPSGLISFQVSAGEDLDILASHDSYHEAGLTIGAETIRESERVFAEIALQYNREKNDGYPPPIFLEVENGQPLHVMELDYIYFDLANWNIREDAAETLTRVANILANYPDLEIRLESHADARGDARLNLALSEKRGKAAFLYLVAKEIYGDRMKYTAYGESRLLNICEDGVDCDEDEHAVNRRTVIKIVREGAFDEERLKRSPFYF